MNSNGRVTTDAVVWIEIDRPNCVIAFFASPLMQWCGLKCFRIAALPLSCIVTTDAVVWIEITLIVRLRSRSIVTTDAVVWIEISISSTL